MVTIESRYVHIRDGRIIHSKYADGTPALEVEADYEGYPEIETLSTNLAHYGLEPPAGHIYVKDYSEHEGLPTALVAAGVAEYVDEVYLGPFNSRFVLMKVVTE